MVCPIESGRSYHYRSRSKVYPRHPFLRSNPPAGEQLEPRPNQKQQQPQEPQEPQEQPQEQDPRPRTQQDLPEAPEMPEVRCSSLFLISGQEEVQPYVSSSLLAELAGPHVGPVIQGVDPQEPQQQEPQQQEPQQQEPQQLEPQPQEPQPQEPQPQEPQQQEPQQQEPAVWQTMLVYWRYLQLVVQVLEAREAILEEAGASVAAILEPEDPREEEEACQAEAYLLVLQELAQSLGFATGLPLQRH